MASKTALMKRRRFKILWKHNIGKLQTEFDDDDNDSDDDIDDSDVSDDDDDV